MKNQIILLLLTFFSISTPGIAQCEFSVNDDGEYEYEEIINLEEKVSSKDLYNAALLSMSKIFNSVDNVIEIQNEEAGYIVGKFTTVSSPFTMGMWKSYFKFSVRLDFKESKYRILINYLSHYATSGKADCSCPNGLTTEKCGASCVPRALWRKQCCEAHENILFMVADLKELIKENSMDNEW